MSQPPFDFLIIGAGFSGSVVASELARRYGQRVLIVDKRSHIGGNAFDKKDAHGILIHPYGPHIFHTNSKNIFDYLSRFTEWRPYEHRVLSNVNGMLVPVPINLDTVNRLYNLDLREDQVEAFFASVAEYRSTIRNSEDVIVSKVGRDLYEKMFRGYTRKQWNLDPSQLDASVIARIPVRTDRDDRYFNDTFQAMPLHGYSRLFENLLDHSNIELALGVEYRDVVQSIGYRNMVYTGPIDEFYDFRFGKLPYRSLTFDHRTIQTAQFQPVGVVNFPGTEPYTRITEFKHLTGQTHRATSVVYEYPCAEGDPYYPIPRSANADLYKRYEALANSETHTYFAGRLATYKYFNMDQVVAQALVLSSKIAAVQGLQAFEARLTPVANAGSSLVT